jgi:hypothetical protein
MSINPQPPDPYQVSSGAQPTDTSRKWSKKDWLAKVYIPMIVPIVAALIAGGYFFFKPSSSSIPLLHSTYSGTYYDSTLGASGQLSMFNTSEDTSTGAFTSSGTINTPTGTCSLQNTDGKITADGKISWTANYEQSSACNAGKAYVTGQLHDGAITGSWNNADPSIHDTGTFTLS